jgi:hypothetical protein
MKSSNPNSRRAVILLGIVAALSTTLACSHKQKQTAASQQSEIATVRPAALKTVIPAAPQSEIVKVENKDVVSSKTPAVKLVTYRSRDYGVSFVYPWQYKYVNAKTIANNESLLPKSDGFEDQFTLARVDIPKGFYPDTNFESAYFTLSLDQDINQEQCESSLKTSADAKLPVETMNGVNFAWVETNDGGRGEASKIRNYAAYANDTCYEVELGVKTKNDHGLARDVDPDQVMHRLEAMLKSVKVQSDSKMGGPQLESSVEVPTTTAQK